jgi:hypothetical protein
MVSLSLRSPSSYSPGRLLVSPHAGAVEKHHAELHAALLNKAGEPLPDAGTGESG